MSRIDSHFTRMGGKKKKDNLEVTVTGRGEELCAFCDLTVRVDARLPIVNPRPVSKPRSGLAGTSILNLYFLVLFYFFSLFPSVVYLHVDCTFFFCFSFSPSV